MPKNFSKDRTWSWSSTTYNKTTGLSSSASGTSNFVGEVGTFAGGGKGDFMTGTPYSFGIQRKTPFSGSYMYEAGIFRESASGSFFGSPGNDGLFANNINADMAEVYNEAVSKLWDDIRGGVDLSVDAFQIRQTLDMLRNPLRSLGKLAKAAKDKSAKGGVSALSDAWLETRYGWMPLLSTIHELAGRPGLSKDGQRHFRKSKRVNRTYGPVDGVIAIRGVPHACQRKLKHECTCTVHCIINLSAADRAQKTARYTSLNPASMAWEMLPYSFVVDWLYDIGGYLRSMESAMMYNSIVQKSWRQDLSVTHSNTKTIGPPAGSAGGYSKVEGDNTIINFARYNISGSPKPTAPVSSRVEDLSWQRWTSAVALVAGLLSR